MQQQEPGGTYAENTLVYDEGPRLNAPLVWRLHKVWRFLRIPLAAAVIVFGWVYVPVLEARSQQDALATAFFAECTKTLKDTEMLPKVPEDALAEAIKKRPITEAAVRSWDPEVASEIKQGQWVAEIVFDKPSAYRIEHKIGPALAESGYDTPSPGL